MTIKLKTILIILLNIESTVCEGCFRNCVYDMLDLKNKITQLENSLTKIDEIENKVQQLNEELQIQKNITKGND